MLACALLLLVGCSSESTGGSGDAADKGSDAGSAPVALRPVLDQPWRPEALVSLDDGRVLVLTEDPLMLSEVRRTGDTFASKDLTPRIGWNYPVSDSSGVGLVRNRKTISIVATPNTVDPNLFTSRSTDNGRTWTPTAGSFDSCESNFVGPAATPAGREVVLVFDESCGTEEGHALGRTPDGSWEDLGFVGDVRTGDGLCSTDAELLWADGIYDIDRGESTWHLRRSVDGSSWEEIPLPAGWPRDMEMLVDCDRDAATISADRDIGSSRRAAAVWDAASGRLTSVHPPAGANDVTTRRGRLISIGSALHVSDDGVKWRKLADISTGGYSEFDTATVGPDGTIYAYALGVIWATTSAPPAEPEEVAREFLERWPSADFDERMPDLMSHHLIGGDSEILPMILALPHEVGGFTDLSCKRYQNDGTQLCKATVGDKLALVMLTRGANGVDWVVSGAKGLFEPDSVENGNYYPPA